VGPTKRFLKRKPSFYTEEITGAAKLQFNVEVIEHSPRKIKLKVNFENPSAVSAVGPDLLTFEIKELSLFKTPTGRPLLVDSFEGGKPSITKVIPPIVADEGQMDTINDSTASAGTTLNFLSTGNFVIALILGGSMQLLWGMIRAM